MLLKRIVRGSLRRARKWLEPEGPPEFFNEGGYGRINHLFLELTTQTKDRCPHLVWGVLHAAHLATQLKLARISVIEFGVAGGNGLINLEQVASVVAQQLQITIDVYGFDTGAGLPPPQDYRDLPNLYRAGGYQMDVPALRRRLTSAQLVLGPVKDTIEPFVASAPAPIAFISFDLDYYSSTKQAFTLLEANPSILLPRVHCYFDDILAYTFSEFTGERLAIAEFNETHALRKISPIYDLRYFLPPAHQNSWWSTSMYLIHLFDHPQYGWDDGLAAGAAPLQENLA